MKTLYTLGSLVVLLFIMAGCRKNAVENSNTIVGSWELRSITGGFRGNQPFTDYAPGNGDSWTVSDSIYQIYNKHILVADGKYSNGKDFSQATGKITDFMLLSVNEKIYFEIEDNRLVLYKGEIAFDGTIEKYERCASENKDQDH